MLREHDRIRIGRWSAPFDLVRRYLVTGIVDAGRNRLAQHNSIVTAMTQIATRTGDDGTTGLGDNTRVSKNSLRVHAMGDVDELNSHIGLLLCEQMPEPCATLLVEVQHQLFNLGGELSIPGFELLKAEAVLALDEALAPHNGQLPRLEEFILPAGNRAASQAHVCRTVARRAERAVVALGAARPAATRHANTSIACPT